MKNLFVLPGAAWLALVAIACGDKQADGAAGVAGAGSSLNVGGSLNLNTGGSTGGPGSGAASGSNGTRDGGVRELSDAEADALTGAACAGWSAEPETQPAVLQLVVDTSLSMNETPNGRRGRNGDTKWEITRDALKEVLGALPEALAIGLFFYPNMSTEGSATPRPLEACVNTSEGIAVAPLVEQHRARLLDALDAQEPDGWTPTHGAYRHALDTSLLPSASPGPKYLLLITDGAPTLTLTCEGDIGSNSPEPVDAEPIIDEVARARRAGVRTFLIGSPGSEPGRAWMSEAALQGATARAGCHLDGNPYCHMDMTTAPDFAAALRAGLNQVTGEISCTYDIPEPPAGQTIDPALVNLIVTTSTGDAQLVLPDAMGDCSEGWQLMGNQVVLCDGTCSRVQADGASLQLLFGCESGSIPVPK